MNEYYLAVDIGASGGRHILGWLEDGCLKLEEVYRFENGMENKDGHLCWDTERLFSSILFGMKRCAEIGKIPVSVGVDTWGVDFVLLDKNDDIIGQTVGYRDRRTEGMDLKVLEKIPTEELYRRTGIQKQLINSVYQLEAIKETQPEDLEKAETLLMIPDYFHFLLTGVKSCEYTEATTGQMVSTETKDWDRELIRTLGFPEHIFQPLSTPGTVIGNLRPEIQRKVGYDCKVTLPATHDTGSAVLAVPSQDKDFLFISSGTWSLMGTEVSEAIVSKESMESSFTNEGGYGERFLCIKNIMGLWMIQSVRNELGKKYSYEQLCDLAEENNSFPSRVDVYDERFLSPDSMTEEIRSACRQQGMPEPQSVGELACVIYRSLAECYAKTAKEIEAITEKTYNAIYIVGGGSNADYLNRLTAETSKKTVYAGPGEATAVGNLCIQMLSAGKLKDVADARSCVFRSFSIKEYKL